MATTYSTALYANKTPPNTGHGFNTSSVHLHAISGSISTWVAADTINMGYLPPNAIVCGALLKSSAQLDTGAAALTLSLGVPGTTGLFKSLITTVGRGAGNGGVTGDNTLAGPGMLYKNTTGAKQLVIVTVGTGAATPAAGSLECDIEYYVEDAAGSAP